MTGPKRRWIDRTRPLRKVGNRIEAFQLRRFGWSPAVDGEPPPVVATELVGEDRTRAAARAVETWTGVAGYERRSCRPVPYFTLALRWE